MVKKDVLKIIPDGHSHQGEKDTIALVEEHFYWNTMYYDVVDYVVNCPQCHVANGYYVGPHTQCIPLVAHYATELLCINFTNIHPAKNVKENVHMLTNTLLKFSQALLLFDKHVTK